MAHLKYRWRENRPRYVSGLLLFVVRAIGSTMRVRTHGRTDYPGPVIYCGWHGRSFLFSHYFRNRGTWVVISQSRDGEIQANIFRRLGFQIIRGSTGRGGARAAVEAIRALRAGGEMAMTPDGPRGPSHVLQPGILTFAQRSGALLVPTTTAARPAWTINSWDRYLIPLPFSRGVVVAGEPISVPPDADEAQLEEIRLRLEAAMNEVEAEAERRLGRKALP